MFLSLVLLNWYFIHWDEGEIIKFAPLIKKLALNIDEKPPKENFLFLNVSYDKELTEYLDEFGFPVGNQAITDRKKLSELFKILAEKNEHVAIVCDIRLEINADSDSQLQKSVSNLKNVFFSRHFTNNSLNPIVIDVPWAISDYPIVNGAFIKFKYFYQDSIKTMPIKLYESINKKDFTGSEYTFSDGENLYLNTFITDLKIRPYDLFEVQENYPYSNLGELLLIEKSEIEKIAKGKIIVIGDFQESDMHDSLLGDMPGPLLLTNAYLTILNKENKVTFPIILFLFTVFLLLSLKVFLPEDPVEKWILVFTKNQKFIVFFSNILSYFMIILLIVFSTYFIFGVLLNILWLVPYLYLLEKIVDFIHDKWGKNLFHMIEESN